MEVLIDRNVIVYQFDESLLFVGLIEEKTMSNPAVNENETPATKGSLTVSYTHL